MSFESTLVALINPLLIGGAHPDTAPIGTKKPYAVYQQVGGDVINPLNGSVPGLRHARVQIIVWATKRTEATSIMNAIEDSLRPSPMQARPIGALIARMDEQSELRGAMQDFEFWHS